MVATRSSVLLLAALFAGQGLAQETVLLNFTSASCPPCRSMEPVLQRLAGEGHPIRHVDVMQERRLATRFQVTRTPTFVMVVDNREFARVVGATGYADLKDILSRATAAAPRAQSPDSYQTVQVDPASFDNRPSSIANQPVSADSLIAATVRIKVEDATGFSHGTGTIFQASDGSALVVTCGHLFRDAAANVPIEVDLFKSGSGGATRLATSQGQLLHFDIKREVGVLRIAVPGAVAAAPLGDPRTPLNAGQRVTSVGCDNGNPPTAWDARITSINRYLGPSNIEATGTPVVGRSGGGLFNERGELIGVCYAADERANEGIYAGLPAIYEGLEAARVSPIAAVPQAGGVPVAAGGSGDSVDASAFAANSTGPQTLPPAATYNPPPAVTVEENLPSLAAGERAAIEEIARRAADGEVICIIRKPGERSEIITIQKPSPQFIAILSRIGQTSPQPRLTALQATPPTAANRPLTTAGNVRWTAGSRR